MFRITYLELSRFFKDITLKNMPNIVPVCMIRTVVLLLLQNTHRLKHILDIVQPPETFVKKIHFCGLDYFKMAG